MHASSNGNCVNVTSLLSIDCLHKDRTLHKDTFIHTHTRDKKQIDFPHAS